MADPHSLPDRLSRDEQRKLLKRAEDLWRDLQANNLGGFSDGNRPFWIVAEFKAAIEQFGHRDVGLKWSKNAEDAAVNVRCCEIADQAVPEYRNGTRSYSCGSHTGKRWEAAWNGACIALGRDPEEFSR